MMSIDNPRVFLYQFSVLRDHCGMRELARNLVAARLGADVITHLIGPFQSDVLCPS